MKRILLLIVSLLLAGQAAANEEIILVQDGSPLVIEAYDASYKMPERGIGDGSIVHRLSIRNVSESKIQAYGIGFHTFDAFKRSMGRPFIGYDMSVISVGDQASPLWENRALSAFLFRRHGLGIAYVAIVRLEDGTIWRADESSITGQLTQLELDLTVADEFK